MSVSDGFLKLVRRVSSDLDVEKIRVDIEEFSRRHEGLTTRHKAERLITLTARRAALVGVAASLPPGWTSLLAAGPELTALIVMQSKMIVGLHLLYGGEIDPDDRAVEVLVGLASGAGMRFGRQLTARAAEEIAGKLLVRFVGREVSHVVPVAGAVAAAALNLVAVKAVGRAVLRRVEERYGPPGIPGAGPVLEVGGRVE